MNPRDDLEPVSEKEDGSEYSLEAGAPPRRRIPRDLLVGAGIALLLGAMVCVVGVPRRDNKFNSVCQSNIRQITLAMKQYVRDYDEKLPIFGSVQTSDWASGIAPYIKSDQVFQCPTEPHRAVPGSGAGYSDYFYNRHASGIRESAFEYIAHTVLIGDHRTGDGSSHIGSTRELDPEAQRRHMEGANYSFADGHVMWAFPGAISDKPVTAQRYSFQYK